MTDIYQKLGIPRREESTQVYRDMQAEINALIYSAAYMLSDYAVHFINGGKGRSYISINVEQVEEYLSKYFDPLMVEVGEYPARQCEFMSGLSMFVDSLNRFYRTSDDEAVTEEARIMLTIIKMWREWELI